MMAAGWRPRGIIFLCCNPFTWHVTPHHSKGFDPKGVLSNRTISAFFDEPPASQQQNAKGKGKAKEASS